MAYVSFQGPIPGPLFRASVFQDFEALAIDVTFLLMQLLAAPLGYRDNSHKSEP
jgi:hypothetical protein